jgi:predicted transcriptional regulator
MEPLRRDTRGGRVRQFGDLEATIMDRLWAWNRPATVRDVLEDLQRHRTIAYTTVMTVMDNLHRKGVLAREREGRAYVYWPIRSREEHSAALMEEVLADSTDRTATLTHFVQKMSPRELARLRRVVDKAGGRGRRR